MEPSAFRNKEKSILDARSLPILGVYFSTCVEGLTLLYYNVTNLTLLSTEIAIFSYHTAVSKQPCLVKRCQICLSLEILIFVIS